MLVVPNFIWIKYQPEGYAEYASHENKLLLALERVGEVLVSCLLLVTRNFNLQKISIWSLLLAAAFVLMLLYELFWVRYFRSRKTMMDFYCNMFGIPVPGASLPVAAVILIGIYRKDIFLIVSAIVLGIGHITIHLNHRKESLQETIVGGLNEKDRFIGL